MFAVRPGWSSEFDACVGLDATDPAEAAACAGGVPPPPPGPDRCGCERGFGWSG